MSALRAEQIEDLRRAHHATPWLPSEAEAEVYGHDRVRMSSPDPGEDLLHRYREVLCGVSPKGWSDSVFLDGYRFEWALADLLACTHCDCSECSTVEVKSWRDGKGDPITLRNWTGCRSFAGGGMYMDLHRKKTQEAGYPIFVMTNCKSPAQRLIDIHGRTVSWR